MKTVAEQWKSFRDEVMPPNVSRIQQQEMRRAFYAGAQALLTLMVVNVTDEMSDEEGGEYTNSLSEELMAFAKDVKEGRA